MNMTQVNPCDAGPVRVAWLTNESQDAIKPTYQGLRDMFEHLWSRLHDVAFLADFASRRSDLCETARKEMGEIAQIANVWQVYGAMQRLLNEASKNEVRAEDNLRAQIASLFEENCRLRASMSGQDAGSAQA